MPKRGSAAISFTILSYSAKMLYITDGAMLCLALCTFREEIQKGVGGLTFLAEKRGSGREGEKKGSERQRQLGGKRETDRQTDKQTDRERDRQTETEKDRHREKETERETEGQTDRDTARERQTETDREKERQTETERETVTERERWVGKRETVRGVGGGGEREKECPSAAKLLRNNLNEVVVNFMDQDIQMQVPCSLPTNHRFLILPACIETPSWMESC